MPIYFTRLKISGFKSFAHTTSLDILPGLTGIVGPNGCGKSNIIEAIRWVMGESSARSLRGSEMDDVIFAGTARHTAYNIAEVTLTLEKNKSPVQDNNDQTIPSYFEKQNLIEISRQIERESGSQYRLNGKLQRARDIQTLFEDLGSGPRSTAIIGQNRIAQLISATPEERRQVLEEAAGISGLHNRRREAELKLKATKENLCRLNDLREQLEDLTNTLREQFKQTLQYRAISAFLRKEETHLNALYYLRAKNNLFFLKKQIKSTADEIKEKNHHIQELKTNLDNLERESTYFHQQEIQARIHWDYQHQHIVSLKNELTQVNKEIEQLNDRIKEAKNQSVIAQSHIEKNQVEQQNIEQQINQIQEKIHKIPANKTDKEQHIATLEKQCSSLNSQIIDLNHILFKTQRKNHETTQNFNQISKEKDRLQSNYDQIFSEHQQCLKSLPSTEELKEKEQFIQQTQQNLHAIAIQNQAIKTKIQSMELEANKYSYHVQQIEKNYNNLAQSIERTTIQKTQLEQEKFKLLDQIKCLETRRFHSKDQNQFRKKITQLQTTLFQKNREIENAISEHQSAIKIRLEQENFYNQSLQTYEQGKFFFETAQKDWQQTQETYHRLKKQVKKLSNQRIKKEYLQEKKTLYKNIENKLVNQKVVLENLDQAIRQNNKALEKQSSIYAKHKSQLYQLKAKQEGLQQILSETLEIDHQTKLIPVLDPSTIPEEWIVLVTTIFDNSLEAPMGNYENYGWIEFPKLQTQFSSKLQTLSDFILPPPALRRAFDHIGIVHSVEEGNKLFPFLLPGQILATQAGDIWRWDGYYQSHFKQNNAAQRLIQKHNLQHVEEKLECLQKQTPELDALLNHLKSQQKDLKHQFFNEKYTYKNIENQKQKIAQDFLTLQNEDKLIQTKLDVLQSSLNQAENNVNLKTNSLKRAQQKLNIPLPSQENIKRFLYSEQEKELNIKQKQQSFKAIQDELTHLKDQYQQKLNQESQNKAKIISLQNKQYYIHEELDKKNKQLIHLKTQLQNAENPNKALQTFKEMKSVISTLNKDYHKENERFLQEESRFKQTEKEYQQLKEYAIQQKSRLETLNHHYHKLEKDLQEISILFHKAESNLQQCINCDELEKKLNKLKKDHQNIKNKKEQKKLDYCLTLQEKINLENQKENLLQNLTKWKNYLKERQSEKDNIDQKILALKQHYKTISKKHESLKIQLATIQQAKQQAEINYLELQKKNNAILEQKNDFKKRYESLLNERQKINESLIKSQTKKEQAENLFLKLDHEITDDIKNLIIQNPKLDLKDQSEKKIKNTILSLKEQREAMGAVNLRAEFEYKAKQEQLNHLKNEFSELTITIQYLHEAIHKLNQHGKSKLNAIFKEVNQHFQELFSRMFNGGQAYLKLFPHEDPLQSGLEIFAQPPGKKLSTLSLLSGGEQALTTLSLVFAVSRCNHVPICILDEVDASLDDPNVERFCALLSDMTKRAGTRFLIVTHHQLTMSHMNRLYGITMQERGISQLISIDLENALQIQQSKQHEQLKLY